MFENCPKGCKYLQKYFFFEKLKKYFDKLSKKNFEKKNDEKAWKVFENFRKLSNILVNFTIILNNCPIAEKFVKKFQKFVQKLRRFIFQFLKNFPKYLKSCPKFFFLIICPKSLQTFRKIDQ